MGIFRGHIDVPPKKHLNISYMARRDYTNGKQIKVAVVRNYQKVLAHLIPAKRSLKKFCKSDFPPILTG